MSQRDLGLTRPTQEVLTALVGQPVRELNAGDIRAQTGRPVGTIYPMLARLEALQWVDSSWQHPPVQHAGSRQRYYRLNPCGFAMTRRELAHQARASTGEPS
jgi:PadR family transcriptional regulator, regulatory protein PadR